MGKGGSSAPTQTTSNVTQTNLPKYVRPQYERLLSRAESQSIAPYTPYGGQRVSQPAPDTNAAYDITRGVATSGIAGLQEAANVTSGNIAAGQNVFANAQPYQFDQSQFQAQQAQPFGGFQQTQAQPFSDFQQSQASQFGYQPTEMFTGQNVGQYMSPYMQQVVDVQKSQAQRDFDEQRGARNTAAVNAGAFGGSRRFVQEGLAERGLMDRMADIQASGQQSAFESAQQAFQADRAAQFGREQAQAGELGRVQSMDAQEAARVQAARAAELGRVQGLDAQEAARVQAARAAELARTQGISIDEAARVQQAQFQADQAQAGENRASQADQLAALGFTGQQAQQLVGLGETARAGDIQGAQLLENIGRSQQAQEQEGLDVAYQDFLRQQAFPEQQLQLYSSILRGVPVQPSSVQTGYAPNNPFQQALGGGLGAIGLYRGLSG